MSEARSAATRIPARAIRVRRVEGPELVSVRVLIPGGARAERERGVCTLTGRMLEEGTAGTDWRRLAERVESRGMELVTFGDYDGHGVAIDGLARDLELAIDLAAEIVREPRFDEARLDIVRAQEAQVLDAIEESPEAATGWAFLAAVYDGRRRGVPLQGSRGELDRVDAALCRSFHEARVAGGVIVSAAGDLDEVAADALLASRFERLSPGIGAACDSVASWADERMPGGSLRDVVEVSTDADDQAHLYIGHRTVPRAHPDRLALIVLGIILGGGAGNSGRIPDRIREELGLAYSTYATTVSGAGLDPGHLVIYAGTSQRRVDAVRQEAVEQLERLLAEPVRSEELSGAVGFLLGREPFRRETGRQWAGRLVEEELYGLHGWSGSLAERLTALRPERLLEIARRWIHPRRLRIVIGRP